MQDADEFRERSISYDSNNSQGSPRNFISPTEQMKQLRFHFYDQNDLPFETEIIASQTMDYIVTKGAMALYEKYLLEKLAEFEAQQTVGFLTALTSQGYCFGDPGESPQDIKTYWTAEKEPVVMEYDSRSSYAVNVEFKEEEPINEQDRDDSDARSVISIMSNSSRFSMSSRKTNKLLTNSVRVINASKLLISSQGEIPGKNASTLNSKHLIEKNYQAEIVRMPDEAPPEIDPDAERLRLVREKKDYARSLELEKQRKQQQEDIDFENKKKDAQKLLKHKLFTHDFNGDIILLKKDRDPKEIPTNLINLDAKSRLPAEIAKPATCAEDDGKKVKLMNYRGKEPMKTIETLEFSNQPLLHLTFKANPGSKLMTMQGLKKEGGYYTIQNRMRKEQYDTLIGSLPNRPVVNYLGGRDSLKSKKSLDGDKTDENQPRLSIHSSSQIRIGNRDALLDMLEEEKSRKKRQIPPGSLANIESQKEFEKSIGEMVEEQLLKEKEKIERERRRIELAKLVRLEKITIYQLQDGDTDLGLSAASALLDKKKKQQPLTKLHQEVEKFDLKNIKDPCWGDANPARSHAQLLGEEKRKRGLTPVDVQTRKNQRKMNSSKTPLNFMAKTFFQP